MAREQGFSVDKEGFRSADERATIAGTCGAEKTAIELSEADGESDHEFLGLNDHDHTEVPFVIAITPANGKTAVVLNNSVCYAEMGGQVGDTGRNAKRGSQLGNLGHQKSGQRRFTVEIGSIPAGAGSPARKSDPSQSRSTPPVRDRTAPHCHASFALGAARNRVARCGAEGKLCRAGQVDVRFFECGADAGAEARCWRNW